MKKFLKEEKEIEDFKEAIGFLKVISEKNRLFILHLLRKGELCVCEIWEASKLPQNLVSNHLKILRDFGLINSQREGKKIMYSLNKKNIKKYFYLLSRFIN